jgi:protein ImuA
MNAGTRSELIRDLKERLRRWEGIDRNPTGAAVCSTGTSELDRLLPRGGLGGGVILEWLSQGEGQGAVSLALILAARVLEHGGALVVIDPRREFYPPGAVYLGIDLERTVVVQPSGERQALWALEQALRSPAASVVFGWCDRGGQQALRRLQLAAEAGGGLGFLLRPATCRGEPSWAEARLLVQAAPGRAGGVSSRMTRDSSGGLRPPLALTREALGRRLRIEVLHCRSGFGGEAITLELTHEAGHVHLAAVLADPTPPRRKARA